MSAGLKSSRWQPEEQNHKSRTGVVRVATLSVTVATLSLYALVPPASAGASMSSTGASKLAASASTPRAQAGIDPTSIAQALISSVAKSAGSKIGGALAGWALDAIFGPSPQKDDETKLLLNDLQTQVKGVR